jgi:hypothetical protein
MAFVELPGEAALVPSPTTPAATRAQAVAFVLAILYSLTLAAGGGTVFYASIRPVSIPTGYFAIFDLWYAALLLLAITWLAGPVVLLIVGLIYVRQSARRNWLSAIAWTGAVAAGTAIGYAIMHDFALLFNAHASYPDGTPVGPSRFAPGTPYWQALIALGGQLAVGAGMIALITTSAERSRPLATTTKQEPS